MNRREKVVAIPCKKGYASEIVITCKHVDDDEMFVITCTGLNDFVLSFRKSEYRWNFDDIFTNESQEQELIREIFLTGCITFDGYSDRYFLVPGVYDIGDDKLVREGVIHKYRPERDNSYYDSNLSIWDEFCARYRVNKNSFYIEAVDTDVIVKKVSDIRAIINLNANRFDCTGEDITPLDRKPTRSQSKLLNFIMRNINDFEVSDE